MTHDNKVTIYWTGALVAALVAVVVIAYVLT